MNITFLLTARLRSSPALFPSGKVTHIKSPPLGTLYSTYYFLTWAAGALAGTSGILFSIGSYVLYFVLSFLIPSTSGMATVSMPIMGPLAQQLNFNPAVMVMVFSAASGAVNLITPTSGAIMGGLALARIEYGTWVKFAVKVVAAIAVVSMVILAIAMVAIPA